MKNERDEQRNLRPRVEKIFFSSGDIVEIKHDIPNKPVMIVHSVDKISMKVGDKVSLLGVTCIWFSTDLKIQKHRFSTKDIKKVDSDD